MTRNSNWNFKKQTSPFWSNVAMTGLSVYAEFPGGFGIKKLMPIHKANRGYRAWQYIEPIMMMLYGGGRHAEDLRKVLKI